MMLDTSAHYGQWTGIPSQLPPQLLFGAPTPGGALGVPGGFGMPFAAVQPLAPPVPPQLALQSLCAQLAQSIAPGIGAYAPFGAAPFGAPGAISPQIAGLATLPFQGGSVQSGIPGPSPTLWPGQPPLSFGPPLFGHPPYFGGQPPYFLGPALFSQQGVPGIAQQLALAALLSHGLAAAQRWSAGGSHAPMTATLQPAYAYTG